MQTTKVVTVDGKDYIHRATVGITGDTVHVTEATRVPVAKLVDGGGEVQIWAYRTSGAVVLFAALDAGAFDRATFYGCSIQELRMTLPSQSLSFSSSAKNANWARRELEQYVEPDAVTRTRRWWSGEDYQVEASVSRSSSDPSPLVSVVLKR